MDNDCTVLVIEDDDGARDSLCEYLSAAGYDVRKARGGAEALTALGTAAPDAVLLRGGGWGHGAGMCQWGAVGRAEAGQGYREILRAYYAGAEVARVY